MPIFVQTRCVNICLLTAWAWLSTGSVSATEGHALDRMMSEGDRVHLLSRSGFGASLAERAALQGLTRRQGVERIVAGLRDTPAQPMPAWTRRPLPHYHARGFLPPAGRAGFDRARDREIASLRNWWTVEMLQTDSPATERLVLLWHDLVPTAYSAIGRHSLAMARQNALFRSSHQGGWAGLLKALIRDPALLRYLNGDRNLRQHPNENLARELLELFTLGEGHYDEATVREAARALTGHGIATIADLSFVLRPGQQDRDEKSLFGAAGPFDGDDLIELILAQPAAARHLARVYWHHYISDRAPGEAELDALADPFRASGHSLAVLYRGVLESPAFWDEAQRATSVKSPVDIAVGLARTLEYPKADWAIVPTLQASMGLDLFAPPNVAGWNEGDAWLAPGRLLARFEAAARLVGSDGAPPRLGEGEGMGMGMGMGMDTGAGKDGDPAGAMMNRMAADDEAGRKRPPGTRLTLDVASEAWRGPVELQVAVLDAGGATLWESPVRALKRGRDTGRQGTAGNRADLPREQLHMSVPRTVHRQAEAVRIAFLNDAAGPDGDRNLYVNHVRLGRDVTRPDGARQDSACPPDSAAHALDLWCEGSVTLALNPVRTDVKPGDPPVAAQPGASGDGPWAAAAVRVLGAQRDDAAVTSSTRLILEHVTGPDGFAAELAQVSVLERDNGQVELQLGSFDCRPSDACVPRWPECARSDPRFPQMKRLHYRLDQRGAAARGCRPDQLPARTRELLAALADGLPQLLRRARDTADRQPDRQGRIDRLLPRIDAMADGSAPDAWRIDPARRPPSAPPDAIASIRPAVAGADALQALADRHGLDPVAGLLPGIDGLAGTIAPDGLPIDQRLRTVLAHPAFQLH